MNISDDHPLVRELGAREKALGGLTTEQAVSCLLWGVASFCGERGRQVYDRLRAEHEGKGGLWTFDFDELAEELGIEGEDLLHIFLVGVTRYGARIKNGTALQ